MEYSIDQLRDDVLLRKGETRMEALQGMQGVPTVADVVEAKVRSLLPEVGRRLILEAPSERLVGAEKYESVGVARKLSNGLYVFEFTIPDDFLRLVSMRMASWRSMVHSVVTPDLKSYCRRFSDEPGISGCQSRPKVYLCDNILSAYSSDSSSDAPEHFLYWRLPIADKNGKFRFPASLYPDLVATISDKL